LEWARKNTKNAELTGTLNNLGILDTALGRVEEARKEYAEALQIRRELAEKDPGNYDLVASTLNNLGELDRQQGRLEEARKESEEALRISRQLAEKNPEIHRPHLARIFHNPVRLHDPCRLWRFES